MWEQGSQNGRGVFTNSCADTPAPAAAAPAGCGAAGPIPGSLRDHLVAEKARHRRIAAVSINCEFRTAPRRKEKTDALCRQQRSCSALFRGDRQRDTDHLPARIRRRPHQLGAADALFRARPPLHRLFRPRLCAVRCAGLARGLYLPAFLHRRTRRARSSRDRQSASGRLVDGVLFVAADRAHRARPGAVDDTGRRRLRLRPQQPRRLSPAMPGHRRATRPKGPVHTSWDGRTASGRLAPDGDYHLRVDLRSLDRTITIPTLWCSTTHRRW